MVNHFTRHSIDDRSYVAFVKREIHSQATQKNFSRARVAEIDIIVAELCSNLIKHAGNGQLLFRFGGSEDAPVLEILSIDNGPGMADVPRMMKDGVSTTNTLGQGLGAIMRLAAFAQIYSLPKWGTICYVVVKSVAGEERRLVNGLDIRTLLVPKPKEILCGDGWSMKRKANRITILFADGLGHGEHAFDAVRKASEEFQLCQEEEPVEIIRTIHQKVKKTRGLVGTIAVLDMANRQWRFCGVGNVITRVYGGMMFKHYLSYNGIIGLNIPNSLNETVVEAEKNQQLVMCSDGLRTRWELTKYPSLLKFDHLILAAALYKDHTRGNDDSSVLVGKVMLER